MGTPGKIETEAESLLNIKQAAKILNASEISLRRWSDSGKLPCLRIGVKRERRYRLSDLLAYLEQDQGSMIASGSPTHRIAHVDLEGISIHYGSHLCALYDNDPGRLKLAIPFLVNGLQKGDRCFVVADTAVQSIFLQELSDISSGIDEAIQQGELVLMAGMPDGNQLYDYFEQSFLNACKQGIQGLRVVGDMAWALKQGVTMNDLMAFENRYNQGIGHRYPVVSLCQYDARLFSGEAILNALKCHEDTFHYPLSHFLGA